MRYLIAYHEMSGKGFTSTEPFIYDEFENNRDECLRIASDLVDDGYNFVTPFVAKGKRESYDWKYVSEHKLVAMEE